MTCQNKEIGREPWHISYLPVAEQLQQQFNPAILLSAWDNEVISGKPILTRYIEEIFQRFCL